MVCGGDEELRRKRREIFREENSLDSREERKQRRKRRKIFGLWKKGRTMKEQGGKEKRRRKTRKIVKDGKHLVSRGEEGKGGNFFGREHLADLDAAPALRKKNQPNNIWHLPFKISTTCGTLLYKLGTLLGPPLSSIPIRGTRGHIAVTEREL